MLRGGGGGGGGGIDGGFKELDELVFNGLVYV